VVEHVLNIQKALGSTPRTQTKQETNKKTNNRWKAKISSKN
jgi:hypothetical protein